MNFKQYYIRLLYNKDAHIRHKKFEKLKVNKDELHIKMRNCKRSKMVKDQSRDYAAIRVGKKVSRRILQTCTHLHKKS
jgi:hypothetical protein